eukprot:TRINITY_DN5646_c0_g2_i1.p3 TRINITY_DN5646_c0_g2~~TRINITY_DN5646_c0_g2_i1.p3  ORF type:complete len:253 (-),score=19.06 TRINITY_DN5646_c0_g2_i1:110-868(-)
MGYQELSELQPDLCITAAYGNFLPQRFLDIPKFGTLNIHPSLLPQYRGAAPVPRCLQDGNNVTGVSVAYTVLKMDAGPVLEQQTHRINKEIQAPELLQQLFAIGTDVLIKNLDIVFAGKGLQKAIAQDENSATQAPKLCSQESWLNFSLPAEVVHNKVRALAGWPGTRAMLQVSSGQDRSDFELKIVKTSINCDESLQTEDDIQFIDSRLFIKCGDGKLLEILSVQPSGKKIMDIKSFKNGLVGKQLHLMCP